VASFLYISLLTRATSHSHFILLDSINVRVESSEQYSSSFSNFLQPPDILFVLGPNIPPQHSPQSQQQGMSRNFMRFPGWETQGQEQETQLPLTVRLPHLVASHPRYSSVSGYPSWNSTERQSRFQTPSTASESSDGSIRLYTHRYATASLPGFFCGAIS
jgi:hypothetical protein